MQNCYFHLTVSQRKYAQDSSKKMITGYTNRSCNHTKIVLPHEKCENRMGAKTNLFYITPTLPSPIEFFRKCTTSRQCQPERSLCLAIDREHVNRIVERHYDSTALRHYGNTASVYSLNAILRNCKVFKQWSRRQSNFLIRSNVERVKLSVIKYDNKYIYIILITREGNPPIPIEPT